jgi:TonB family protein
VTLCVHPAIPLYIFIGNMSTRNSIREDVVLALGAEYEILRELGRGGASVVYLGRDLVLGREVAIKVVRDTHTGDGEAIARFEREARTLASLQHPNIVMLYGAKPLPGGSLALVMQHGEWSTLKAVIREQGPLPIAAVNQVLNDLASALVYLHRHHVVHRDIKPENIFIEAESGRALISDFGIAKSGDSRTSVTLTGVVIGTPAYMSPEQIDGGELTGRSDLYSLGMVGYEMLTGVRPWDGESLFSVIYKQKTERLPSLRQVRPDTPEQLQRIIEKATEKRPEDRWSSAQEILYELGSTQGAPAPVAPVWAEAVATASAPIPQSEYPTLDIEQALAEEAFHDRERVRTRKQRLMAALVVLLLFGGGAGALAFSGRDLASEDTGDALGSSSIEPIPSYPTAQTGTSGPLVSAVDTTRLLFDETTDSSLAPSTTDVAAPAERRSPPSQRQAARAVDVEEEQPAAARRQTVLTGPRSPAPELAVTRPRSMSANAMPSRELESRRAHNAIPPRLRNRDQVGQLLMERYPTDLRTRGVGGTTVVTVLVMPSGSVESSRVITSSGNTRLDQAALAVAERMLFTQPAGITVQPMWVAVPLTFTAP